MMPLSFALENEKRKIIKIGGDEKIHHFLESLGFVVGAEVSVISRVNGNIIVSIKDSRVAISKTIANKIMV
ncbi:MAG: ferrous iron transport protein A [Clostridiales bacterium]|nr:ferrous iron transport protein A [Clostridiales bacterium]